MKTAQNKREFDRRHKLAGAGRHAGFTMVEIAICLAVIGIALVAIIGVMPTGLRSSKDSRHESIIEQDAKFFMEAIRGMASSNMFPNVESIDGNAGPFQAREVIGRLSAVGTHNAIIRALSGPVTMQSTNSAVGFRYLLTVKVAPFRNNPNLHSVQLEFRWPLKGDNTWAVQAGTGAPRTFPMLISGQLVEDSQGSGLFFFQP